MPHSKLDQFHEEIAANQDWFVHKIEELSTKKQLTEARRAALRFAALLFEDALRSYYEI